jgi:phosphatidylglycerophosphate synthase
VHPWRDRLSRWFTPFARRVPLSPNALTVLALVLNMAAAAALLDGPRRPLSFFLSIVLLAIGGLLDALDGIVARVQNKTSRYGDFLDHVADRISDTVLAAAWMIANDVGRPIMIAGLIGVMMNGYIGTQIEATFGRRSYETLGRGEFVLTMVVLPITSYILFANGWNTLRFSHYTVAEWLSLVLLVFALLGIVQRLRLAARMESE